jgi:Zn-dependent protease
MPVELMRHWGPTIMGWSVKIARVAGTEIKIHITFLLFLLWIAFVYYQVGGRAAAIEGVVFIVLLFLCVLLHELGHVVTAKSFGITTPDITLLPFGGVARMPAHAGQTSARNHGRAGWSGRPSMRLTARPGTVISPLSHSSPVLS